MTKRLLVLAVMTLAFVAAISADVPIPPCPPNCDFASSPVR
jgi:hypothetical protein